MTSDLSPSQWCGGEREGLRKNLGSCLFVIKRALKGLIPSGERLRMGRELSPTRLKLSIKSDYAARAVLWLSQHYAEGEARTVEEMATDQNIPPNYLVQILIELKSANIVRSLRGKEGGYLLARPPGQITFGDVLRCIHGEIFDSPALGNPPSPPELRGAWQQLRQAVNQTADSITFQQLVEASQDKGKMYYI